jgi:hypothetical protein
MEKNDFEQDISSFFPNWDQILTPEEAERELNGFEFKGPGWYYTDTDTVLVIPMDKEYFRFCVWGDCDPTSAFRWIINAPIRLDKRSPSEEQLKQVHEAITDTDLNFFGE